MMYTGIVEKTKRRLQSIAIDKTEKTSANEIIELLVDSLDVIKILEDECRSQYTEGRADGMETMATILTGQAERSE